MKKSFILSLMVTVFCASLGWSGLAWADFEDNAKPLVEYFGDEVKIKEGSFIGHGAKNFQIIENEIRCEQKSENKYHLTLIKYNESTSGVYTVILQKIPPIEEDLATSIVKKDSDVEIYTRAFFALPKKSAQLELIRFTFDVDKSIVLPPYSQPAEHSLELIQLKNGEVILWLKPNSEEYAGETVFNESVIFRLGKEVQFFRDVEALDGHVNASGDNQFHVWKDESYESCDESSCDEASPDQFLSKFTSSLWSRFNFKRILAISG